MLHDDGLDDVRDYKHSDAAAEAHDVESGHHDDVNDDADDADDDDGDEDNHNYDDDDDDGEGNDEGVTEDVRLQLMLS